MKATVAYPFQFLSCIIMLLAFLWLSTGASFVQVGLQKAGTSKMASKSGNPDDAGAPFDNASEEKTENSPNVFSEDYLGEHPDHIIYAIIPLKHEKVHAADAFLDFYGESVSPPPKSLPC